jgi:hypothetical protein
MPRRAKSRRVTVACRARRTKNPSTVPVDTFFSRPPRYAAAREHSLARSREALKQAAREESVRCRAALSPSRSKQHALRVRR